MKLFSLCLFLFFSNFAFAGRVKIPHKANTAVIASSKNPDLFYKELKERAVAQDYYFIHKDDQSRVFVTNFYDLSKKTSIQIKAYVKKVRGGSNAVINAKFYKLKKLNRTPNMRPYTLEYRKGGKPGRQAWEAFYRFAVGSQDWKHQFVKY